MEDTGLWWRGTSVISKLFISHKPNFCEKCGFKLFSFQSPTGTLDFNDFLYYCALPVCFSPNTEENPLKCTAFFLSDGKETH